MPSPTPERKKKPDGKFQQTNPHCFTLKAKRMSVAPMKR
jgi:hypothetical protein